MIQKEREGSFVIHERCGATYQIWSAAEQVAASADCPVCTAIRADYARTGGLVNRTTAGTPLAEELGLVVTVGQVGV